MNTENDGMLARLSDPARQVLALAAGAARSLNHDYIGTEHILLGLSQDDTCAVSSALKTLGADASQIRLKVGHLVHSGPQAVSQRKLPFTPRAKRAIECAEEEAWNLQQDRIGPEHLVLGLLREREGVAGQILLSLGLDLDAVRERVFELRMNQLKFVERIVRPVRAGTTRKRKMREELLAHLTAVYDEELARLHDPTAAMHAAAERFGKPDVLSHELQSALPAAEQVSYFLDRWFGWRPPESAARWIRRMAVYMFCLLTSALVLATAVVVHEFGWNGSVWIALRPVVGMVLLVPPTVSMLALLYFDLRNTLFGVFGARKSLPLSFGLGVLMGLIVLVAGVSFAVFAEWSLVRAKMSLISYGTTGMATAIAAWLIARTNGPTEIRDALWASLRIEGASRLGD
jgi:ATP-dependent Clp protease ATP-binding subunit ClpC